MDKIKRIIAMFAAVILVMTVFPVSSYAGGQTIGSARVMLDEPVAGEKPGSSAGVRQGEAYYVSSVKWKNFTSGEYLGASDTFEYGCEYVVEVFLKPFGGWKFDPAPQLIKKGESTINGYVLDSSDANVAGTGTISNKEQNTRCLVYHFPILEDEKAQETPSVIEEPEEPGETPEIEEPEEPGEIPEIGEPEEPGETHEIGEPEAPGETPEIAEPEELGEISEIGEPGEPEEPGETPEAGEPEEPGETPVVEESGEPAEPEAPGEIINPIAGSDPVPAKSKSQAVLSSTPETVSEPDTTEETEAEAVEAVPEPSLTVVSNKPVASKNTVEEPKSDDTVSETNEETALDIKLWEDPELYADVLKQQLLETFSESGMEIMVYDVTLKVKDENGEWVEATVDNFPEDGKLTVVLPYPEGTDKDHFRFFVGHMFTKDYFGKTPGDIEYPEARLTDEGVEFDVTGLSPIALGWLEVFESNSPKVVVTTIGPNGDTLDINDTDTPGAARPASKSFWYIFASIATLAFAAFVYILTDRYKKTKENK